jgi:hypothetical protein
MHMVLGNDVPLLTSENLERLGKLIAGLPILMIVIVNIVDMTAMIGVIIESVIVGMIGIGEGIDVGPVNITESEIMNIIETMTVNTIEIDLIVVANTFLEKFNLCDKDKLSFLVELWTVSPRDNLHNHRVRRAYADWLVGRQTVKDDRGWHGSDFDI